MTKCSVVWLCAFFVQAYSNPGRFFFDHRRPSNPDGRRHSPHSWDHGWGPHSWDQHDWFSGHHSSHRMKTTQPPTTFGEDLDRDGVGNINPRSTSDIPKQPVSTDVEIRNKPNPDAAAASFGISAVNSDDKNTATTESLEVRIPPEISLAKTNFGELAITDVRDTSGTFNTANVAVAAEDTNAKAAEGMFGISVTPNVADDKKLTIDTARIEAVPFGAAKQMTSIPENLETSSHWHVAIYSTKQLPYRQICGGSLLKRDTVLSAGHCFWNSDSGQLPANLFRAVAGKLHEAWGDIRDNAQYAEIKNIIISTMYAPCYVPDLALLTLATPFTYGDFVKPVCLNYDEDLEKRQLTRGNVGVVAGWGQTANNCTLSERLTWSRLPFVDRKDCSTETIVRNENYKGDICAGIVGDKTQCEIDSGSGLVFFEDNIPYLRGVTVSRSSHKLCYTYHTPSFAAIHRPPIPDFGVELHPYEECYKFYNKTAFGNAPSETEGVSSDVIPILGGFDNSTQASDLEVAFPTAPTNEVFTVGTLEIGATPVLGLNGTNAPEYEWHVGVYTKRFTPYMQICGGSLVKRDVILSAAHCFWEDATGQQPASMYAVAGGKLFRPWADKEDTYAQRSDVSEIVLPIRFRGGTTNFQDDIAVVRLSTPFTYALGVQPVCVDFDAQFEKQQLRARNRGTVAGWGLTEKNGGPAQRLNYLELPYVEIGDCIARSEVTFLKYITSDKICAGDQQAGKALCRGDSGGGFVLYSDVVPYLRGIASTAPANDNLCNDLAIASFTHISAHRNFLLENIPDIDKECINIDFSRQNIGGGDILPESRNNSSTFGIIPPVSVNVPPVSGNVAPISGNVSPISGNVAPISGNITPISGNVAPISGNVAPISGNVAPISGNVAPISGNVAPISGNVASISGNIRPINVTPTSGDVLTTTTNAPFTSNKLALESGTVVTHYTTTPIYSVPYNNFICNCHCKP